LWGGAGGEENRGSPGFFVKSAALRGVKPCHGESERTETERQTGFYALMIIVS
jgi:hypothetical protein